MEDGEVDFIINEFLGNLCSVENEVVPAKSRRNHHVHWWDGWENQPKAEPEDLKALKSELIAILERTGANKKVVMEELRKRTREDKTGESVKCLVLAYYKMNSLILGSELKDTNNFASKVYKMLQLEYFEEHGKFPVEEGESTKEREEKSLNAHTNGMQNAPHYVANDGPLISLPNMESLNKITTAAQIETEEDSRCLATEDISSAGIIELKEVGESQEIKAAHDPEAFGMLENKDSDDLLLWFVEIEEEWNALIAGSSPTPQKQNWNMSNSTPILHKHPLTTQSLTDIDRDATQDIWQQNEFIHDTPQEIPGGGMFGESDSLFGEHGGERRRLDGEGDNIVSHFHYAQIVDDGLGNKDLVENLQMYGPRGYQAGVDEEGQGKTPDRAPARSPPHSVLEVLPCDASNRHGWLKVDVPLMVIVLIQTPGHYCLECLGDVPWIMAVGASFLDRSLPSHVHLGSESIFYEEFLMQVCIFTKNGRSCLNGNLSFIDVKRKILLCGQEVITQEVLTQMTKGRGKFAGINLRETCCSDGVWQYNPIGIIKFDPRQEQSCWSSSVLESDDKRLIVEAEKKEQNAVKDPETRASVKDEGCAENMIDKTGRYRGNERGTNLHLARIDVPYHATNCECFFALFPGLC